MMNEIIIMKKILNALLPVGKPTFSQIMLVGSGAFFITHDVPAIFTWFNVSIWLYEYSSLKVTKAPIGTRTFSLSN